MKIKTIFLLLFISLGVVPYSFSQNESWFFIRAKSENFNPEFERIDGLLVYKGGDQKLKKIFSNYSISEFKKTYQNAKKSSLKRTFFVVVNDQQLLEDLLINASEEFDFGEIIMETDKKIFEPNDYGLTSTIGANKGLAINLDYYDLVNLNVHLPSIFMNDNSQFYSDFVNNYYLKYFSYPEKYAYSAYQQCLYFLSSEFKGLLDFKTFPNTSFQSNTKFNIIRYSDFERLIVQ